MAYLGNTLINGSLRCLNKAYFGDLSVSGTTSFANLDVSGKTTTNQLVVNNSNNPGTLSSTNSNTGNIPVIIGNPNGKHIAIDGDEIAAKNGVTTASDMWLNYGGGAVYLGSGGLTYLRNNVFVAPTLNSTTSTITTGNITTLKASTATADNLTVNNVLKSSKWDISNVANLANDFMVAPTIKISSSGTVNIASLNDTAKTCTLTFSDATQINSDEFGGCKWYKNSKVRVTFVVNGTLNSNIEGIVKNNMNTSAGSLAIDVTLDNITGLANGTYNATDATIMLYEMASGSNLYPVGIRMTAYGTNNSSYIDMYGGTASTDYTHPIVRIGRLNGITFNGKTFGTNELPAAWGIYTLNGYFEGAVVANEGKIANFTIASDKLYTGEHSTYDANKDGIFINNTYISFGKQALTYFKNDGTGKIGTWVIGSNALTNGTWGANNSAMVCTGSSTAKAIGGSESISGWTFTSGANFGVTKTGALYANDVNISGAVNATALHVGSSTSTNHLIYENSTIDLQTDWLKFDSSTNTVIIGKDNAPRVNIDGQSMSLTDKDDNVYFKIGDMRVNGMYVFTTSKPDIVVTGVDHDHTPSYYADASCDIDENYDVKVFDEDDVELEYSSISHIELYGKIIGRVWLTKTSLVTDKIIKLAYTTTSGIYNFRYGDRSTSRSDGVFSVCFSKDGETNGSYAFAIGKFTEASGVASFSSGLHSKSTGEYSHAEGYYTEALNSCSHAEGFRTVAEGGYSHSEGCDSVAHGFANHAEGYECHAYNGGAGHAEGWGTKSYGNGTHSEGWYTVAASAYSHAEGYYTRADGYGSHTSGAYTKATRDYQTVIGKYNANHSTNTIFDSGDYAFIIGNGTNNNSASRSNALTVDWNGNLWCAGKVNDVDLYCISTEGTLASSNYQTAIGKYNIEDTNNAYAFIIGNGASEDSRSNALTVDWDGNIRTNGCYINKRTDTTMGTHPSSDYYYACFLMRDSTDSDYARILHTHFTDGKAGFTIEALRQVNNSPVYNSLRLLVDDSGTRTVQVSDTAAWRNGLGMGNYLAIYSNPNNNNNQSYSQVPCSGFLTDGSKQITFHFPVNIIAGSITIKSLSLAVRGGSGQEYLYEASGSGTTYTQLGTSPVSVWENGASKRTNGVVSANGYLKARSGITVIVNFKNQLRKSASTTVAQNNMPVGLYVTMSYTVS